MRRLCILALAFLLAVLPAAASAKGAGDGTDTAEGRRVPGDEEFSAWTLADFPDRFRETYASSAETIPFMADSEVPNEIVHIKGEEEGPCIVYVCGIHGDETAGWICGNLMKSVTLKAGEIYILAPANKYGAEHDQRTTRMGFDPNRYYPGKQDGTDAERLDYAIYEFIRSVHPSLVMDLHEGLVHTDGADNLGNSVIFEDAGLMPDLILDIVFASDDDNLCNGLTVYAAPPEGSLNRTVTRSLGIPVITVETCRGEAPGLRVDKQLELEEFILKHEGLR